MDTAEKYDLDALVELPEMKTVLDEIREVNRAILVEMIKVWDKTPKDQIPDMELIDLKYDPRLKELRKRVNEIARAHSE